MPMFIHRDGHISKPQFRNHQPTMLKYHDILFKQIEAFMESGTITLLPPGKKGWVCMPVMLVHGKRSRMCHDGGLSKTSEMFPTPIRMESFDDIFRLIVIYNESLIYHIQNMS